MTKNRIVILSLLLMAILLSVIFWPGEHLNNFDNLATRAVGIDTEFRMLINAIPLALVWLLFYVVSSEKMSRPITEQASKKFYIVIALTSFAFIPALNFNSQYFSFFSDIYRIIGIGHIGSGFGDLAGVIEGSSKVARPGEYFQIDCPGTCVQYRWQYSRFLLHLPFESFLLNSTQIIAFTMWLLIVSVSILGFRNLFFAPLVLLGFVVPASLLAYERMNIENFIFLIIPLIAYCSLTKFKNIITPILIIVLTVVKFYPVILVILFMVLEKMKLRQVLIYGCTLAVGLILSFPDLRTIGRTNLVAGYAGSYGLPNLLSLLSGNSNPYFTGIDFYWFLIGLIFCLFFVIFGSRIKIEPNLKTSIEVRLFLVSSVLGISAWATNSNYMYRLILILWSFPLLIRLLKSEKVVIGFALSCYLVGSSLIPISLSPIRNILIAAFFSIQIGICLKLTMSASEGKDSRHLTDSNSRIVGRY